MRPKANLIASESANVLPFPFFKCRMLIGQKIASNYHNCYLGFDWTIKNDDVSRVVSPIFSCAFASFQKGLKHFYGSEDY